MFLEFCKNESLKSVNCVYGNDSVTEWVQATEHLVQTMGFSVSAIQKNSEFTM